MNDELHNRNAELSRMIDDLASMLESVDLPIAMVSQDLLLRRFTSPAGRLLNLLPGDLGRPFADIRSNLVDVDLPALVKEAVVSEQTLQHLVRASDGRSFSLWCDRRGPVKSATTAP